jgi:GntR family transcriptional regulator
MTDAAGRPPERGKRHEIVAAILEVTRDLAPGTAIPSERDLATRYGVSRMTLRAAIDDLVRDGYLVRRHGAGTFVARPRIAKQIHLTSFTEDMRSRGLVASTRVLSLARKPAGARIGARLGVSPSETVVIVGRLRLADGDPMAIEWVHVPDRMLPGIGRADFEGSFYRVLGDRFGIVIDGGTQTLEPTVTDERESELLGVPLHSPILFVERVTWTADGTPVEYTRTMYRGDRYRFTVDLARPAVRPREG